MWVRKRIRRWQKRDGFDKIDLYTRGSLHSMAWAMVLCVAALSVTRPVRYSDAPAALIALTVLAAVAQGACTVPLIPRTLDRYLGRRAAGLWLIALAAGLFTVNAAGLLALGWYAGTEDFPEFQVALGAVTLPLLTSLVLVVPLWASGVCVALLGAGMSGGTLLAGADGTFALATFFGVVFGGGLVTSTVRLSAWTLGLMKKLRDAQDVETRLAVAEERLRFGRDLHDVLGRNLAVIALKSELAVELAQRGKPTAVEQMIEVQRIARDSQQEVRDVVRGYREADLYTELVGARSVLQAAGISCEVQESGSRRRERLPASVQSALGWVVREAATNVLRHGDPQRCAIRLRTSDGTVRLVVENDGVPPDAAPFPPSGPVQGSGLRGLRERLSALDGRLEAGPADGGLFRLTATVPLAPPAEGAPSVGDTSSAEGASLPESAPPAESTAQHQLEERR
ncbi:sensor histidine kinase [Streptomyces nitrosporeus]|nr:sensor histidine kinase [Streptomyces nitrosporeus]GGZ16988.1 histidine kinase [Streptomyces nitrosporeus]